MTKLLESQKQVRSILASSTSQERIVRQPKEQQSSKGNITNSGKFLKTLIAQHNNNSSANNKAAAPPTSFSNRAISMLESINNCT